MNRWLYVSLALTAFALAAASYVYVNRFDLLPDKVPTHWGITGEPDGFTARDSMLPILMAFPGIMAVILVMSVVLPLVSPKQFSVDEFRDTFSYLMMLVVALFAYMNAVALTAYVHPDIDVSRLFVAGIFLFFALLGNQLGKVRRNFWMGVRTPWTLANETVWVQTHRLAAWLFTGAGVVGFVAALFGESLILCFLLLMVAAISPVVYSLVLYKRLERQGKV
jgi:uncharacterized membrane protein